MKQYLQNPGTNPQHRDTAWLPSSAEIYTDQLHIMTRLFIRGLLDNAAPSYYQVMAPSAPNLKTIV